MHTRKILSLAVSGAILFAATGFQAQASSHREAPFITEQPKVDGTDWYAFRSYEPGRADFVTFIADYQPLQAPYGGPNYFQMDPDALYEMHISNNGDANEEITFQFRFRNDQANLTVPVNGVQVRVPLINIGGITAGAGGSDALNVRESYEVRVVRGDRRAGFSNGGLLTNVADTNSATRNRFAKPVDNIGTKSISNYAAYANNFIYNVSIPGCTTGVATQGRVFVGQRKDPFAINLGEIFDLVNVTNPVGGRDVEADDLADANVTSLALEVPISCLTSGTETVIGSWTTASLRQGRLINPTPGTNGGATREGGAWTQVSRLGAPLVNEVVIGLGDKDKFNASEPNGDAQFLTYVTNPTLPALLEILFGANAADPADRLGYVAPKVFPRTDLIAAFLTGVPGVNQPANVVPSEMLRLNTAVIATPAAAQNNLGAAACFVEGAPVLTNPGCDAAGFPNGRRPGDDIVDIELRVAAGYLLPKNTDTNPTGDVPLTDGVTSNATEYLTAFPYINPPLPGSPNGTPAIPATPVVN